MVYVIHCWLRQCQLHLHHRFLGNNECFEPYTSNIYTRRVLSGEFVIVNKHLLKDLVNLGLWNDDDEEQDHRCKWFSSKY